MKSTNHIILPFIIFAPIHNRERERKGERLKEKEEDQEQKIAAADNAECCD